MRRVDWNALDTAGRLTALARPALARSAEVAAEVARIVSQVRADGDHTLRALTRRYDGAELERFVVGDDELDVATRAIEPALALAIDEAAARIRRFHAAGAPQPYAVETAPGVRCERIVRAIDPVGLYVPAGSAPLPSTALMLAIPAVLAGCREIVLATPPRSDGRADPAVLYAARRCGVTRIVKLGGAQAIAALAYGTESVPKCAKVFGPGNAWVTAAKQYVALDPEGAAIDLPAGPSEVLVVADARAKPAYVAADLLAQAEHGPDSHAVLVSESRALIDAALRELECQLASLPRRDIAAQALAAGVAIEVDGLAQAFEVANAYAPEHLVVQVRDAARMLARVENAGSVFLGDDAPEALGDYCSGTNHVLPTYGHARAWSGVSVASFQKLISVQAVDRAGLAAIGPCAMTLARAEGLVAHERAVAVRLAPEVVT